MSTQESDIPPRGTFVTVHSAATGCAYVVLGPEMEPNPSEWFDSDANDGEGAYVYDEEPGESETGRVRVRMVGDDHVYVVDPSDLKPITDEDFCHECGQVGCCSEVYSSTSEVCS